MADLSIKFTLEKIPLSMFKNFIIDMYGRFASRFFPIFIICDSADIVENGFVEGRDTFNFRVVEAYEDPDQGFRELAKINMMEFSDSIFIEVKGIQEGKNRWYRVEKLFQSVLGNVFEMDYKIQSVVPINFIPYSMVQHTTKQEDKAFDEALAKWESEHGSIKPSGSSLPSQGISLSLAGGEPKEEWVIDDDLSRNIQKYGTYRDLTENDVRTIIKLCRAVQEHEGTIQWFYTDQLPDRYKGKFELETLKSWLKNKKFKPKAIG